MGRPAHETDGLPHETRGAAMARSLATAVGRGGCSEPEVDAVARAFSLAMEPRLVALDDDHHPAYLHPGRSALILLQDVGSVDVAVLVVAVVHESEDSALRVPGPHIQRELGGAARDAVRAIPLPGDERLVERLVTLGPGTGLAALAERLDQLRHLHVRDDLMDSWAQAYEEVLGAWLPFAQRTHPRLATRYRHWARTFVRRI